MRRTESITRALACAAIILASTPLDTRAQLAWESPQMLGPRAPAGFSLAVVDYGLDPNPGLGAMLIWRTAQGHARTGLHASIAQGIGDRINVALGVNRAWPLVRATREFPFDLVWTAGAGASMGEYFEAAVPVGVAFGTSTASSKLRLEPYTAARAVVEARAGDSVVGDAVSLAFAVDVGADLFIGRSQSFALRAAASLGDRHAAAIGLHVSPRRAVAASVR